MFIQGKFKTFEIEENNPLKPYIDYYKKNADKELKSLNDGLEKEGSQLRVSKEDFDKALKYLAPERELKPGDSIQVTDGKITYEDLQEIAKDVKKVLNPDKNFDGKMPRIFIMPKIPTLDFGTSYAVIKLSDGSISNFAYLYNNDTMIINHNFTNKLTAEETKGFVAHEFGHKYLKEAGGVVGIANSTNSPHTVSKSELGKLISCLYHNTEYQSDLIATLANHRYGEALSKAIIKLDVKENYSHPSSEQRAKRIEDALANPGLHKKELREEFANFQKIASNPTYTDSKGNIPAPPTASVVKQCSQSQIH